MSLVNDFAWGTYFPSYDANKERQNALDWLAEIKSSVISCDHYGFYSALENTDIFKGLLSLNEKQNLAKIFYYFAIENDLDLDLLSRINNSFKALISYDQYTEPLDLDLPWEPLADQILDQILNFYSDFIENKPMFFKKDQAYRIIEKILPHAYTGSKSRTANIFQVLVLFLSHQKIDPDKNWINIIFNLWASFESFTTDAIFLHFVENPSESFGRFVANILDISPTDQSYNSDILSLFSRFVNTIENYYHPSSNNKNSKQIYTFLESITNSFFLRIKRESFLHSSKKPLSEISILTKRKFVSSLTKICTFAMFNKSNRFNLIAINCLNFLSQIEPDIVIPPLLDLIHSSFDSFLLPHRMYSILASLSSVSIMLTNFEAYPQGSKHIIPLMKKLASEISFTDIDMSSLIFKLFSSFAMDGVVFGALPVSGSHEDYKDLEVRVELRTNPDLESEAYFARLSTLETNSFLSLFFENAFSLLLSIANASDGSNAISPNQINLCNSIGLTCEAILLQTLPQHHKFVATKTVQFFKQNFDIHGNQFLSKCISTIVNCIPENTLEPILLYTLEKIALELNSNHISGNEWKIKSLNSRKVLLNFTRFLSTLVETVNPRFLIPFSTKIADALCLLFQTCPAKDITEIGSNALMNFIKNLTLSKIDLTHSLPDDLWNSKEFQENHVVYWGKRFHPKDVTQFSFYEASEEAITAVKYIMSKIFLPSIKKLAQLLFETTPNADPLNLDSDISDQILNLLAIINSGVNGMCFIKSALQSSNTALSGTKSFSARCETEDEGDFNFISTFATGNEHLLKYKTELLGFSDFWIQASNSIIEFTRWTYKHSLESVEIYSSLVKLVGNFISYTGIGMNSEQINSVRSMYFTESGLPIPEKSLPLALFKKRITIQTYVRDFINSKSTLPSELDLQILEVLTTLSFSRYRTVQDECLSALSRISDLNKNYIRMFLKLLLEKMLSNNQIINEDEFVGGLRLLISKPSLEICAKDWNFVPNYISVLQKSFDYDTHKIKQVQKNSRFSTEFHSPRKLENPNLEIVDILESFNSDASYIQTRANLVSARDSSFENQYYDLIDSLSKIAIGSEIKLKLKELTFGQILSLLNKKTKVLPSLVLLSAKGLNSPFVSIRAVSSMLFGKLLSATKVNLSSNSKNSLNIADLPFLYFKRGDGNNLKFEDYQISKGTIAIQKIEQYYDDLGCYSYFIPQQIAVSEDSDSENAYKFNNSDFSKIVSSVFDVFSEPNFFENIFKMILSHQKEIERFSYLNALFFSVLFSSLGNTALDLLKPILIDFSSDITHSTKNKIIAEIISGLLLAFKEWPLKETEKVWSWLIPIFEKVLSNVPNDDIEVWSRALSFGLASAFKDPNRYLPLVKLLLVDSSLLSSDIKPSFSNKLAHIKFVKMLIICFSWRITPLCYDFVDDLFSEDIISSKSLRDTGAECLVYFMDAESQTPLYTFEDFIESFSKPYYLNDTEIESGFKSRYENKKISKKQYEVLKKIGDLLAFPEQENSKDFFDNISMDGFATSRLCYDLKFGLRILLNIQNEISNGYKTELVVMNIKKLFLLFNQGLDDEISVLSFCIIEELMFRFLSPPAVNGISVKLLDILNDDSLTWKIKSLGLNCLGCFTILNQYLIDDAVHASIVQFIVDKLNGSHDNIIDSVKYSLTTIIPTLSKDAFDRLLETFLKNLETPIPKILHKNNKNTTQYNRILFEKRANVLGLSCIILAFPYTIPEWMPKALVSLADCVYSPTVISSVASATFKKFKQSRLDTWEFDRLKFSEDQLDLLSEVLVSASYYA
ncbi:hypothetical protein BB560_005447 [Smittium megazygosporum]|uniref:Proteasome activator complex subunit 4 C-terminal domain-containing protein n=1 Tax=Smittium megazygosporum TaxID=133381 RepID=A0A2T9Z5A2_9FUNG|nr:hypothetical protein BB560_005447 [Smittium megazygosporum]